MISSNSSNLLKLLFFFASSPILNETSDEFCTISKYVVESWNADVTFFNGNVTVVIDDGRISMMDFCLNNYRLKENDYLLVNYRN
jgi:hypothetical protein